VQSLPPKMRISCNRAEIAKSILAHAATGEVELELAALINVNVTVVA
jgi:hypothetical protein